MDSHSLPCRIQCTNEFAAVIARQAPDISLMLQSEAWHPQRYKIAYNLAHKQNRLRPGATKLLSQLHPQRYKCPYTLALAPAAQHLPSRLTCCSKLPATDWLALPSAHFPSSNAQLSCAFPAQVAAQAPDCIVNQRRAARAAGRGGSR